MGSDSKLSAWLQAGFRPAAEGSAARHVATTLAETAVFWAVFLLMIPLGLWRAEAWLGVPSFSFPAEARATGLVFAAAGALGVWSGVTMAVQGRGTPLPLAHPARLVIAGPYRFVRNPMAIAGLLQGACVGLLLGSPFTLLYVAAGGVVWDRIVRPIEERDLETRFGEAFCAYRSRVRCWVPRSRPYPLQPSTTNRTPRRSVDG